MHPSDNILAALGQSNYIWQIARDRLDWSENFRALIGFNDGVDLNSARGFESLLSSESQQTRFAVLQSSIAEAAEGEGGSYQCVYAISPKVTSQSEPVWVEDTGRWYADENGKPDYAEGIVRIVSERRKREEFLKRKSELDDLTQLPNRAHLEEMLDIHIREGLAGGKTSAFMLIALHDFDQINSIYGFAAGDEILRQVADLLKSAKRDRDLAARFSGAKFGFVLDNCDVNELEAAAARMLAKVNGRILETSMGPVSLKACAGACLLPRHAANSHDAVAAVTTALDGSKEMFGTRLAVFDPDKPRATGFEQRSELLKRFVQTIEDGAMHLAFQPVVGASSHKPVFHEALLRMIPESEGAIGDAGFLKIAEGLGLMRLLDNKALSLTLDVLDTCPDAVLSVNVTHDSIADGEWLGLLEARLLEVADLAPRLIVELTESQIVTNICETRRVIEKIRSLGCRVAIDDFGAGYTSFAHLRDLPIDWVKIDGSFCQEFQKDPRNGAFLEAMQRLADRFDVKTVVEWVEDAETASVLAEMGYTCMQGSLFGMPLAILPWEKSREPFNIRNKKKSA